MRFFKKLVFVFVTSASLVFAKTSFAATYVCVDTTLGIFCMEMLEADAPATVANFLNYVRDGDFNQTFIHRTIPNSIVQGGGYKLNPLGDEIAQDAEVANEFKVSNTRGTVAMAKMSGQPNSATSEWFVNLTNNTNLDTDNGGFTVFAKIVSGLSVVDQIGASQRVDLTASLGGVFNEVPVTDLDADGVGVEDLMQVNRVFISDVILNNPEDPYACTAEWVSSIAPSRVCMDTPLGTFCIDLLPDAAPLTVANFLHYVADGDYNNSFFHRSVNDFVVQAGAMKLNPLFAPVPTDPVVPNEFKLSNTRGTVAMAKGSAVDSANSQWFVNTNDNASNLDTNTGGFTVFGRVDEQGMAVVDKIAALPIANLDNANSEFPALREVPLLRDTISGDLNTGDFVRISRAYIPGAGPNPCFAVKPAALTEYVDGKFEVPVRVGENIFLILFERELNTEGPLVFRVNLNKIRSMVDRGQETAVYTPGDGWLVIPSVLGGGGNVLTNVRLRLTDPSILQFTLDSFTP